MTNSEIKEPPKKKRKVGDVNNPQDPSHSPKKEEDPKSRRDKKKKDDFPMDPEHKTPPMQSSKNIY